MFRRSWSGGWRSWSSAAWRGAGSLYHGEWEFYGLPWISPATCSSPRSDTEVLAERAILRARAAGEGGRVLDLCAGSSCVGLAVAANVPACRVVLGELSEGALRVCKQNVRRNSLNARVTCVSVNALEPPPLPCGTLTSSPATPPISPLETSGPGYLRAGL